MKIIYSTPHDEMLRVLLLAVRDLEIAKAHIENHNYGHATEWIDAALRRLPVDTDEGGVVWEVYE